MEGGEASQRARGGGARSDVRRSSLDFRTPPQASSQGELCLTASESQRADKELNQGVGYRKKGYVFHVFLAHCMGVNGQLSFSSTLFLGLPLTTLS